MSKPLDFSMILASSIHDMKNSLGLLTHTVDSFAIKFDTEENIEQSSHLSTMRYEASRINRDLMHLLALYRMRENQLAVTIDEQVVYETIEEQLMLNQNLFASRGIAAEIDCDSELLGFYDNELIGSVINNVIVNGVRYTKSKLRLSAFLLDEMLVIEVADDGRGYPEQMLHILDAPLKPISFGSGSTALGLFFAEHLAALHKGKNSQGEELSGRIEMTNGGELEGGIFRLYLPG